MTDTAAPTEKRIITEAEYASTSRTYQTLTREIMMARRDGRHEQAARLARAAKSLEDALTLYDAMNGRR